MAVIEKKAQQEQRRIVCVDEAAFYLLSGVVRTYAPCGETPLLKVLQTRDHLSVMSGITTTGELATLIRRQALTGKESISFLQHLFRYLGDKLIVIWDGGSIHRSNEVKEFLTQGWAGQIHLERLPPYAPDLNPDEGVWQHLKHVELRNVCCNNIDLLNNELRQAIKRVRKKPDLIQSFFAGAKFEL